MNTKTKLKYATLAVMPLFFGCRMGDDRDYLVLDKGNHSVVFRPLDNVSSPRHSMTFDHYADGMDYYNRINIGDTLRFRTRFPEKELAHMHFYYDMRRPVSRIYTINGKTLSWIKEIEKRDSIIRNMHQKEK